jgi:hypothetical protein
MAAGASYVLLAGAALRFALGTSIYSNQDLFDW